MQIQVTPLAMNKNHFKSAITISDCVAMVKAISVKSGAKVHGKCGLLKATNPKPISTKESAKLTKNSVCQSFRWAKKNYL